MVALLIASAEPAAGKTAIAAALGKNLQEKGKKVGYFKPLSAAASDSDSASMKQLLGLKESQDIISPLVRDPDELPAAYARVSPGKDVVIVEAEKSDGIANALDARVVLVAGYPVKPELFARATEFGARLLGVVVNRVPRNRVPDVRSDSRLASAGINLLGVIAEDRTLSALTVGELAERLGGQVLNNAEKAGELIDSYIVGALGLDSAVTYFNRKANKAVVARVERPDMHLAALETPTRCLVITGETAPSHVVLSQAKRKNVPIITVNGDIKEILSRIENAVDNIPFRHGQKLSRMAEVMRSRFDFALVYQGLGLAVK